MGCAVTCADVNELAADYAANRLIWIERWRYRAHLATCPACRRLARKHPSGVQVVTAGPLDALTSMPPVEEEVIDSDSSRSNRAGRA